MACCIEPAIADPALHKPAGVACANCRPDGGCAIYERRPGACRTFFCIWMQAPFMEDHWRPDRSGLLIAPSHHLGGTPSGISVTVPVRQEQEGVLAAPDFAALVTDFVQRGIGVYLHFERPDDDGALEVRLHDWIIPALQAKPTDPGAVAASIAACLEQARSFDAAAPQPT